nr:hypothetical protein [uncultured bacterium]
MTTHACFKRPGGGKIYEKTYTMMGSGFRYVPQPDTPKSSHLACFGCSFMFGIGVNDNETLPARLADNWPNAHVYNFAIGSYGPAQPLLQMQSGVLDELEEGPGAAVFMLMSDHLNRIMPCMSHVLTWAKEFPAFDMDAGGTPRYIGPFSEIYPGRITLFRALSNEQFLLWSGMDIPPRPPQYYADLCGALLGAARDEYRRRFPQNEFYVLVEPSAYGAAKIPEAIKAIRKRGVPVLDPGRIYRGKKLHYEREGHPLPEANQIMADWMCEHFPDGPTGKPVLNGN